MSAFLARQFLSGITLCGCLALAFGASITPQPDTPDQDFTLFPPVFDHFTGSNPNLAIETLNISLAQYRIRHNKHSVTGANG